MLSANRDTMPPACSTLASQLQDWGRTPGWREPGKGLSDSPMDLPEVKRMLLGCFPVVSGLGVPTFFVVRATHLQGSIQVKEADGLGQASIR